MTQPSGTTTRTVEAKLKLDAGQFREAAKKAKESVDGLGEAAKKAGDTSRETSRASREAAESTGSAWQSIGRAAAVAGAAVMAAGAGIAVSAVRAGMAYNVLEQTSRAALTTLLGSAEAAAEQMDRLMEFTSGSPFPRQVWIEAQQTLLAFGMAAEQVVPTLSAIEDAVAAAGGSAVDIQEIVRVLAQVQSTGKVTAETLNQLGVRGVDAAALVGAAMGKTAAQIRDDISSGAMDAATFLTVLTAQMTERFGGAADNIKDQWVGASDRVKAAMRDIGSAVVEPFIDPRGGGRGVDWANDLADALRALETQVRKAVPLLRDQFGPGLDRVSNTLQRLGAAVEDANVEELIDTARAAAPVFTAFGAAVSVAGARSLPIIGGLAGAINPLAAGLAALALTSPQVRELLIELAAAVAPLIPVLGNVAGAAGQILVPVLDTLATLLMPLVPVVGALADGFAALPEPLQAFIAALAIAKLTGFTTTLSQLPGLLASVRTRAASAATGLRRFNTTAGRGTAVLAGLLIAGQVADSMLSLQVRTEALTGALLEYHSSNQVGGELARLYGDDLEQLGRDLEFVANMGGMANLENGAMIEQMAFLGIPVMKLYGGSALSTAERMRALDDALTSLAQKGGPELDAVMALLANQAAVLGISTEELVNSHFPGLAAALDVARYSAENTNPHLEQVASNMGLVGEGAQQAAADLIQAWQQANDEFISVVDAQKDALAGLADEHDLTAEKIIDHLAEQVEAQRNWQRNMVELAGRVPPEVLDELARLGPEGAPLVAALVDASYEEMQEFIRLMGGAANLGGSEFATILATYGPELAAIAAELGWDTAEEIAQAMARNGTTLEEEAARLGIKVVRAFSAGLDDIPDIRVYVDDKSVAEANRKLANLARDRTVKYYLDVPNSAPIPGVMMPTMRWGGAVEHAQTGLLRDAAVYSAGRRPLYAFAEPETGGEAFIPRFGDADRSLAILQRAAAWYGHTIAPAAAGGGRQVVQPQQTIVNHNIYPQKADITTADYEALVRRFEAQQRVGRPR